MILKSARLAAVAILGIGIGLTVLPTPAFAVNKDMVQLQTQIQQLQDAVARLQQSNDERMGVLKDLVQQSADSVNRMSLNMDALQKQMRTQEEAQGTKLDQVSTQVQALNDSLDEMKARIAHLDKALQDIQNQQQAISAQGAAPAGGSAPVTAAPATQPDNTTPPPSDLAPPPPSRRGGKPNARIPLGGNPAPAASSAPPVSDLYKTALGDYMAAKYPLASAEFNDVIHAYPEESLSGNSWYYLGEIDYRAGHYPAAVKDYDHVLEQFPGNPKIPAAQLHKGQALIVQKQNEAGIREFKSLIARYPNSPEATQARSRLNGMGVRR
ncbi:tetratricopeptide repeat protein [Granulicella sibirica]|uniref:Outer membrane lipoprotein BamD-like domain-containing protein n=1 Tax=Granulicella sibirica TaxID=2479048 RepID=A0A4Q0T1B5_9BACT|nr:tetratricopeptide repeat protein [Granulicella sibirica]RXH56572.1 hypothetical protein GRAN_3429 [Granulicella sibirica]